MTRKTPSNSRLVHELAETTAIFINEEARKRNLLGNEHANVIPEMLIALLGVHLAQHFHRSGHAELVELVTKRLEDVIDHTYENMERFAAEGDDGDADAPPSALGLEDLPEEVRNAIGTLLQSMGMDPNDPDMQIEAVKVSPEAAAALREHGAVRNSDRLSPEGKDTADALLRAMGVPPASPEEGPTRTPPFKH